MCRSTRLVAVLSVVFHQTADAIIANDERDKRAYCSKDRWENQASFIPSVHRQRADTASTSAGSPFLSSAKTSAIWERAFERLVRREASLVAHTFLDLHYLPALDCSHLASQDAHHAKFPSKTVGRPFGRSSGCGKPFASAFTACANSMSPSCQQGHAPDAKPTNKTVGCLLGHSAAGRDRRQTDVHTD